MNRNTRRRVVITGLGAVSPLGLTAEQSWENVIKGESGISRITQFDPEEFPSQIAGEVKGFEPSSYIEKKEQKKMALFIQYAIAASEMAVEDSRISRSLLDSEKTGVIVGSGVGGLPHIEETTQTVTQRGPTRISPFYIPMVISNMAAGNVAIRFGAKGPNTCVTSACASGAHSIGEAVRYIRDGTIDRALTGGTESCVSPTAIGGFSAMKALSTRNSQPESASRPFDKDRDGFVLGEGAGILLLEDLKSAEKRGAKIYAEIKGYGLSCDAFHMTNPSFEGSGAIQAMKMALENAGTTDIDYINAHGTSTPLGDPIESLAIEHVFNEQARKIVISSTKSMTGHLLGAAGALETIFCTLALRDQIAPPTINLDTADEKCKLDYAPHIAREMKINNILNNSFGFGGTNASLLLSSFKNN